MSLKRAEEFKSYCAGIGKSMTEVVDEQIDLLLHRRDGEYQGIWERHKAVLYEEWVVSGTGATQRKGRGRCECPLNGCVMTCVAEIAKGDVPGHYTLTERKERYEQALDRDRKDLREYTRNGYVWMGGYGTCSQSARLPQGEYQ